MLNFIVIIFTISLDDIPYYSPTHSSLFSVKLRSQHKSFKITFRYNDHYYQYSMIIR
jgi:hypothetical protein